MNFIPIEKIIQRPKQPQEVGEMDDWDSVEDQLRTKLPEDYKGFIQSFGTGTINEFLCVLNPFSANQCVNLLVQIHIVLDAFQTSKTGFPQYYEDEVYPAPGGLLPFGITDNGEILYWKTSGIPENWTIVVYESRGPKHFCYDGGMEEFLSCMLTGAITCDVLPRSLIKATPTFKPITTN
jgi:hypothetical protein